MPTSNYITYNQFSPALSSLDPNGRSVTPDLSLDNLLNSERNFSALMKRHSYDRLDDIGLARTNPPFETGSSGRVTTIMSDLDARIVRGYIRRTSNNNSDPTNDYRLYFMYNPETIKRNYVSYLDQGALDPFNTIYGSKNLVAPPGVLDFSFDLLFDRQTENANGSMPRGVLEDFDYFDLVVRGVIPDRQNPALPDNGIMMVNPRNITVVFSPQFSVQGRPYSASVSYQKFDHNMRPVRMTISIAMKAFYVGPVRQEFEFAAPKTENDYTATIPYDESIKYSVTTEEVSKAELQLNAEKAGFLQSLGITDSGTDVPNSAYQTVAAIQDITSAPNALIRVTAMQKAKALNPGTAAGEGSHVPYRQLRPVPEEPTDGLDCSGLVYWAYRQAASGGGALEAIGMGQDGSCNTWSLMDAARRLGTMIAGDPGLPAFDESFLNTQVQPGDLLISTEHVAFLQEVKASEKKVITYESNPSPDGQGALRSGPRTQETDYYGYEWAVFGSSGYTHVIRPAIAGNNSVTFFPFSV
jgi:hypothetical protein